MQKTYYLCRAITTKLRVTGAQNKIDEIKKI